MTISQWCLSDRPRERLVAHGAAALSDAELLSILLRPGVAGRSERGMMATTPLSIANSPGFSTANRWA